MKNVETSCREMGKCSAIKMLWYGNIFLNQTSSTQSYSQFQRHELSQMKPVFPAPATNFRFNKFQCEKIAAINYRSGWTTPNKFMRIYKNCSFRSSMNVKNLMNVSEHPIWDLMFLVSTLRDFIASWNISEAKTNNTSCLSSSRRILNSPGNQRLSSLEWLIWASHKIACCMTSYN